MVKWGRFRYHNMPRTRSFLKIFYQSNEFFTVSVLLMIRFNLFHKQYCEVISLNIKQESFCWILSIVSNLILFYLWYLLFKAEKKHCFQREPGSKWEYATYLSNPISFEWFYVRNYHNLDKRAQVCSEQISCKARTKIQNHNLAGLLFALFSMNQIAFTILSITKHLSHRAKESLDLRGLFI